MPGEARSRAPGRATFAGGRKNKAARLGKSLPLALFFFFLKARRFRPFSEPVWRT